ncbi:MAG: UbiA family prenyltransferase, partial [Thermoplasmata archaeon]|nr:UbiA family prenyltransferase [Thermoplasmata archaeon]
LLVFAATASLQLGVVILSEYSDYVEARRNVASTFFAINSGLIATGKVAPEQARATGAAFVAVSAAVVAMLALVVEVPMEATAILALTMALSLAYSVRPVRIARYWAGDISVAFVVGFMLPAAAFAAHAELSHEILWISVPCFIQMVALLIMIDFTDAELAAASNRRNLVVVFGRERAWWLATGAVLTGLVASLATYPLGNHYITSAAMAMAFAEEVVFMQIFRTRGRTQKGYAWLSGLGAAFMIVLMVSIVLTLMTVNTL